MLNLPSESKMYIFLSFNSNHLLFSKKSTNTFSLAPSQIITCFAKNRDVLSLFNHREYLNFSCSNFNSESSSSFAREYFLIFAFNGSPISGFSKRFLKCSNRLLLSANNESICSFSIWNNSDDFSLFILINELRDEIFLLTNIGECEVINIC